MHIEGPADLWDATALPRVLRLSEANGRGYSSEAIRHRLGTGRWRMPLPHTLLTSDTLTWDDRLQAAVTFAGPGALLSGAAALCDLGLASVRRPETLLVLVPGNRAPRSIEWVRVRPSDRPITRSLRPGPARASEARAVADLALDRRQLDDVRALVTEIVRRQICTLDELADELRHGPQRGSAYLRQAIEESRDGAWSAPEARAAALLRRSRVPSFEQNAAVQLRSGRILIADFLWRRLRAVLEIDSDTHHAFAGDADDTADRHLELEADGYSVIHRTPRYVYRRPEFFVSSVRRWLEGRAREFGIPLSAA